jgi:anthranilate phosphoribosyltransferase
VITLKNLLNSILEGNDLSSQEMSHLMSTIMQGEATDAQIAAFLVALRAKGESFQEIVEAAKVMRSLSTPVVVENQEALVDTVGCGDGSSTINVSTCCAFVCATAGVPVAKHGNRSNTSASGSSDVLSAAGVNLDLNAEQVAQCIKECGVGFLFAPKHHSAMRYAINARKEMGIRTLFNLLGPLTNPAGVKNQVIGVFAYQWLEKIAQALQMLGSHHAMVVHSQDKLDEISTAAITDVVELKDNKIHHWTIDPKDFSCAQANLESIVIDSPEESLSILRGVMAGDKGAASDIIILNAAAALYVGGKVASYADGVAFAREVIYSGNVLQKFDEFVQYTQSFKQD